MKLKDKVGVVHVDACNYIVRFKENERKKKSLLKQLKSLTTDFTALLRVAATPKKKKAIESRGYNVSSPKLAAKTLAAFQVSQNVKQSIKTLKKKRQTVQRETQGTGELHSQEKWPH